MIKNCTRVALAGLLAAGIATPAMAQQEAKTALDDYRAVDLSALEARAGDDRVAAALAALMRRDAGAAEELLELATEAQGAEREALGRLVIQSLENQYRYADAVAAAERLNLPKLSSDFTRAYARMPAPAVDIASNVIEVPLDGLRIPARVGDRDVRIALDTGAPGIGIDSDIVEENGWTIDRSAQFISVVPAIDARFPKYATMIEELTIGGATFRNLPANVGDLPAEKRELADRILPQFDIIMGLDAFTNFFDVVEFDYDKGVLRLIRDDDRAPSRANYILGGGAKPVVNARIGEGRANLYVDTGSNRHFFGEGIRQSACERAVRARFRQYDWIEYRTTLALAGGAPVWVSALDGNFGADEAYDVIGVIGQPRAGTLRVDMEDGTVSLENYAFGNVDRGEVTLERIEARCEE